MSESTTFELDGLLDDEFLEPEPEPKSNLFDFPESLEKRRPPRRAAPVKLPQRPVARASKARDVQPLLANAGGPAKSPHRRPSSSEPRPNPYQPQLPQTSTKSAKYQPTSPVSDRRRSYLPDKAPPRATPQPDKAPPPKAASVPETNGAPVSTPVQPETNGARAAVVPPFETGPRPSKLEPQVEPSNPPGKFEAQVEPSSFPAPPKFHPQVDPSVPSIRSLSPGPSERPPPSSVASLSPRALKYRPAHSYESLPEKLNQFMPLDELSPKSVRSKTQFEVDHASEDESPGYAPSNAPVGGDLPPPPSLPREAPSRYRPVQPSGQVESEVDEPRPSRYQPSGQVESEVDEPIVAKPSRYQPPRSQYAPAAGAFEPATPPLPVQPVSRYHPGKAPRSQTAPVVTKLEPVLTKLEPIEPTLSIPPPTIKYRPKPLAPQREPTSGDRPSFCSFRWTTEGRYVLARRAVQIEPVSSIASDYHLYRSFPGPITPKTPTSELLAWLELNPPSILVTALRHHLEKTKLTATIPYTSGGCEGSTVDLGDAQLAIAQASGHDWALALLLAHYMGNFKDVARQYIDYLSPDPLPQAVLLLASGHPVFSPDWLPLAAVAHQAGDTEFLRNYSSQLGGAPGIACGVLSGAPLGGSFAHVGTSMLTQVYNRGKPNPLVSPLLLHHAMTLADYGLSQAAQKYIDVLAAGKYHHQELTKLRERFKTGNSWLDKVWTRLDKFIGGDIPSPATTRANSICAPYSSRLSDSPQSAMWRQYEVHDDTVKEYVPPEEKKEWKLFKSEKRPIQAKLGSSVNHFYYDETHKRWLDKRKPVEEQVKEEKAPPPPRKATTPVATGVKRGKRRNYVSVLK
ncbi:uncharacterized protein LODBEIA_P56830 [Lodderomyces beijingensis]|uniref:Sec16 Sec23-binding domain-containing protein n=1 Tax=Lodderomyces beijingensis TaxID=1775926 RepID=A0ABP0ZTI6_9ASCO